MQHSQLSVAASQLLPTLLLEHRHSTSDSCKQCSPAQSCAMRMLQLLVAFSAVHAGRCHARK